METDLLAEETAQQMVAMLKQGTLAQIQRAGHMVFEDNPADFIEAVKGWLAS